MLNSNYLLFIIAGLSIVSVKTYPSIFTQLAGRDTWLAVAIAMIIILCYISFLVWVCQKKKCYSLARIYRHTLGPLLGNLMLSFFIVSVLLVLLECVSIEPSAMHEHFLIDQPPGLFMVSFIAAGLYISLKGTQTVISTTLIHITGVSISGMGLFVLVAHYKNYDYLFPLMADGITSDFVLAVIKLLGAYSSIAIILPLLSRVSDKENILKHTLLGTLFVAQNQVISMIGTISTFSLPWLNAMFYPKLLQTQLVSHFDFMEAGELFVLYQLVGGWLIKCVLCFFVAILLLKLVGISKKYYICLISVIILFASHYLTHNIFTLFNALNYFLYISAINLILIPLLIFSIFLFKDTHTIHNGRKKTLTP